MLSTKMTSTERRAVVSLALIMALRLIGLFMIIPIFALYAKELEGATPQLIGLALGIYGITQALLQIPFGMLSDHIGRRRVIVFGFLLFALGSAIAALSHTIYGVLLGRALQGGGAIGSTLMALIADLTRENQRSKAMAITGMSIGLSFGLSIIIGPVLAQWLPIQNLFWIACFFSFVAIFILYAFTPTPPTPHFHPDTEPEARFVRTLLKNPELLRLNGGIFCLHAIFTATFVVLPLNLKTALSFTTQEQWKLYLPVLFIAFALSLIMITQAEKKQRLKSYFLAGIITLALAQLFFRFFASYNLLSIIGLCLFFTAFSLLEAFLPSLVSRSASATRRGTAMGLYSCLQFLGVFVGGSIGGFLYQHQGLLAVYPFCFALCLLWLLFAYKMNPPQHLRTHSA